LQLDKTKILTPIASDIASVRLSKPNVFFGSNQGRPLLCRIPFRVRNTNQYKITDILKAKVINITQ